MSLIKLSNYHYVDCDQIIGCEIFQKEDNCWRVKWHTEIGGIESDAFTSRVAAANYVDLINEEIKMLVSDPLG